MNLAYEIRDLRFSYDNSTALFIEELLIPSGRIVALLGPNGSGKTTLLHNLAFLVVPQTGTIKFFGELQTHRNLLDLRRKVGLLLQVPYLFHETVLANVMWGLRVRGIPRNRSREIARATLEQVGLSGFEKRFARSLSGGESQRVALARALALEPEVLLLDEPTNHLDKESAERIEEIVIELNRGYDKTVVIATHDAQTVQKLAHQVINLCDGRMVNDLSSSSSCADPDYNNSRK